MYASYYTPVNSYYTVYPVSVNPVQLLGCVLKTFFIDIFSKRFIYMCYNLNILRFASFKIYFKSMYVIFVIFTIVCIFLILLEYIAYVYAS